MDWRTNLHPDGHIYLHGVPYDASHPLTIYNRIEVENISKHPLSIGKIQFFPLDKGKAGFYGKLVYGLTNEGILEPDTILMVYFFQANGLGYGYQGKLEIPVLNQRTGIHAHIFTHAVSPRQSIKPIGIHSGVFPVFIFEGLRLALEPPKGEAEKIQPKQDKRGEHLLLSFSDLVGTFYGGPEEPPKPPRMTVVWSYGPQVYVREDVVKEPLIIEDGAISYIHRFIDNVILYPVAELYGELEEKKTTSYYISEETHFIKHPLVMLDGTLEEKKYTTLPAIVEENHFIKHPLVMLDGAIETKSYSTITITEETHFIKHPLVMLDGILETK